MRSYRVADFQKMKQWFDARQADHELRRRLLERIHLQDQALCNNFGQNVLVYFLVQTCPTQFDLLEGYSQQPNSV